MKICCICDENGFNIEMMVIEKKKSVLTIEVPDGISEKEFAATLQKLYNESRKAKVDPEEVINAIVKTPVYICDGIIGMAPYEGVIANPTTLSVAKQGVTNNGIALGAMQLQEDVDFFKELNEMKVNPNFYQ